MNNWTIVNILWDYNLFLDKVFKYLDNDKINILNLELDHICYRVSTIEKYEYITKKLLAYWKLLSEETINWRNISTFKLFDPIEYRWRKIYVLEIPSPKKWSFYSEWYEHIEFVIDNTFSNFISIYPDIEFITKDIEKKHNPDIKIQYNNCSVKFHNCSLEYKIKNIL